MAATMLIREKNGAGETATDKTSGTIRFKNADNATVDLNNPMVVPPSGTDFSFEKWVRLNLGGDYTQITNLRFYTDGSNGYGTGIGAFGKTEETYSQPAEATSTSGYTTIFDYTSGSPLSLGSGPYTEDGDIGSYLVMIATVADTASQGLKSAETLTFAWDEI